MPKLQQIVLRDRVEPGEKGEALFDELIANALAMELPDEVQYLNADLVEGTVRVIREVVPKPLILPWQTATLRELLGSGSQYRAACYGDACRKGKMTANEIRKAEGLAPMPREPKPAEPKAAKRKPGRPSKRSTRSRG